MEGEPVFTDEDRAKIGKHATEKEQNRVIKSINLQPNHLKN